MTDYPIEPVIVDAECQRLLDEAGLNIRVGDWYINGYHTLVQVTGFHVYRYQHRIDGEQLTLYVDVATKGGRKDSINAVDYFKGGSTSRYYRLHTDPDTAYREALEEIENPTDDEMAVNSQTTALTVSFGAEKMKAIAAEVEAKATRAMVLRLLVERKLQSLYAKHDWMEKQLKYTYRVIRLLETYLGIYEKIIVLREGETASADAPISIRQLIIYMDEEVGSVRTKGGQIGIDFRNISEFDQWVCEEENLNAVLPELRGVVAMRPSRQRRVYSEDPLDQTDKENNYIYLLIRNGAKVSRVWANMKMSGYDRLFPTSEEMQELFDQMAKEDVSDEEALKLKEDELDWQQNAVLLEGLLDRTDVFQPLEVPVSLFNPASYAQGRLLLIRDAEPSLAATSGYVTYKEWHKKINASLKRGSRILIAGIPWEEFRDNGWKDIFWGNYNSYPEPPPAGVYTLDDVVYGREYEVQVADNYDPNDDTWMKEHTYHTEKHRDEWVKFLYMPGDGTRWTWEDGYVDRQRRIGCHLKRNDWFILAYDLIDLETVEYYIKNRIERGDYQRILPTLYRLRDERAQERESEEPFVKLVANDLGCPEAMVWEEGVKWWKFKVIDHRPIAQDDAKAWRMIRARLKRMIESALNAIEADTDV